MVGAGAWIIGQKIVGGRLGLAQYLGEINMPQGSAIGNSRPDRYVVFFGCVLIAMAIAGIFSGSQYLIAAAAVAPILIFLILYAIRHPNIALLLVIVSYMFNVQPKYGVITSNTVLTAICIFSIVANKNMKIIVDIKCIFWMVVYLLMISFSYFYSHKAMNWYDINLYINNLVLLVLMFVFNEEKKIEAAYKIIVLGSLVLVLFGFYEIATRGIPVGGMRGYFENHVMYALHIAWGIPLSFYFVKKYKSKLYFSVLIVLLVGESFAFSRGVLMALSMAFLLTALVVRWPSFTRKAKMVLAVSFTMFIVALPIMMQNYNSIAHDIGIRNVNAASSSRITLYRAAWRIFKIHPIVGIGWDKYKDVWSEYSDMLRPKYASRAWFGNWKIQPHSSYLKILVELGVIGFMVFFILNVSILYSLKTTIVTTIGLPLFFMLLIYYFHGFIDNNSYGNERMFYIAVGILFSIKNMNKSKIEPAKEIAPSSAT